MSTPTLCPWAQAWFQGQGHYVTEWPWYLSEQTPQSMLWVLGTTILLPGLCVSLCDLGKVEKELLSDNSSKPSKGLPSSGQVNESLFR